MKLNTIQDEDVVNQLDTEYVASMDYVDELFKKAYLWYMKDNKYTNPPIWATDYQPKGWDLYGYFDVAIEKKKNLYCIELEVPDDLVIKSDFDYWHSVLNDWPLAEDDEDIRKEESWKRIYDETYVFPGDEGSEKHFQYTIPSIKPGYVKSIKQVNKGLRYRLYKISRKIRK